MRKKVLNFDVKNLSRKNGFHSLKRLCKRKSLFLLKYRYDSHLIRPLSKGKEIVVPLKVQLAKKMSAFRYHCKRIILKSRFIRIVGL